MVEWLQFQRAVPTGVVPFQSPGNKDVVDGMVHLQLKCFIYKEWRIMAFACNNVDFSVVIEEIVQ